MGESDTGGKEKWVRKKWWKSGLTDQGDGDAVQLQTAVVLPAAALSQARGVNDKLHTASS